MGRIIVIAGLISAVARARAWPTNGIVAIIAPQAPRTTVRPSSTRPRTSALTVAMLLHSHEWYGGGSPPARYLVPLLPVLALCAYVGRGYATLGVTIDCPL